MGTDKLPGVWMSVAWGLGGLPIILIVLLPATQIAIASMTLDGLLAAIVNTTWITAIQRTVPENYLGRYFAIEQAGGYSKVPAGIMFGGTLVTLYGVGDAFLVSGFAMLFVGLLLIAGKGTRIWGRVNPE